MTPAALDFLCQRFPKCFDLSNPQPLKIGIRKDILASIPIEVSRNAIENAINVYVKNLDYLKNVVDGRGRVDLQGAPSGVVAPEEATYARRRFELAQPPPGTKPPGPNKPTLTLPKKQHRKD
jgi:ProP effector